MCKILIPTVSETASIDERRGLMFDALYNADLSEEVEKKNGLTYISWSQAWKVLKQFYPSATYQIHTNPATGLPYFESDLGIMVHTSVEAGGIEYHDWLPCMDYQNRSMKSSPYTIQVYDKYKKQYVEKRIDAATTFDINSAIQRSMVRAIARHGLGLYIYNGFDHLSDETNEPTPTPRVVPQAPADPYAGIKNAINGVSDINALMSLYLDHQQEVESNSDIKALFSTRRTQLQNR